MNMTDIICRKRDGLKLCADEIQFFIDGYTNGTIPDYQASALLMAIVLKGMDREETSLLTEAMLNSGDTIDLSAIDGIKADKHSTGGVGDKTSLVLCPMVAALGIKIAKLSGRGLGHTGGTIDKLESFKGFNVSLTDEQFIRNVNRTGIAIAGQSADLVPADKKLYALRDVTGTVPSIPLIVSSIMSKKLASGADIIVLDVKQGDGSFMKTFEQAHELAKELVYTGKAAGKKTAAVITEMDEPLGAAIGNALEVKEAIEVLSGGGNEELKELCFTLGSCIITEAGIAKDDAEARAMLTGVLNDGSAKRKLAELIEAQNGDSSAVYDTALLPSAPVVYEVKSEKSGFISRIEAQKVGLVSMHLGGGRVTKESTIDLSVGIVLEKKVGDNVRIGDTLAYIHAADEKSAAEASQLLMDCFVYSDAPVKKPKLIKDIIR